MRFFLLSLCVVGSLVWLGINKVSARFQIDQYSFALNDARLTWNELEDKRNRLEIERSRLLDPNRLEPIALKAGLSVARPDAIVRLPEPHRHDKAGEMQ